MINPFRVLYTLSGKTLHLQLDFANLSSKRLTFFVPLLIIIYWHQEKNLLVPYFFCLFSDRKEFSRWTEKESQQPCPVHLCSHLQKIPVLADNGLRRIIPVSIQFFADFTPLHQACRLRILFQRKIAASNFAHLPLRSHTDLHPEPPGRCIRPGGFQAVGVVKTEDGKVCRVFK